MKQRILTDKEDITFHLKLAKDHIYAGRIGQASALLEHLIDVYGVRGSQPIDDELVKSISEN